VPAAASFLVDARARTVDEQLRVDKALHALTPVLAEASLEILGGPNRPPLERKLSVGLFEQASRLAVSLGLAPLREISVGGGSDGNFTAGVGTATLDGLGAVGGGAHADDEHVVVAEIAPRTALLVALINDLLDGS
jgi:glutamate carboxypeptidase